MSTDFCFYPNEEDSSPPSDPELPAADQPQKKRGAPVGHPGWFRPTPTQYDWDVEVRAPRRCPHCQGHVSVFPSLDTVDHQAIEEMFGISFTPAALIGFETVLAERAEPVVEDIAKKLASSDGPVYADET